MKTLAVAQFTPKSLAQFAPNYTQYVDCKVFIVNSAEGIHASEKKTFTSSEGFASADGLKGKQLN